LSKVANYYKALEHIWKKIANSPYHWHPRRRQPPWGWECWERPQAWSTECEGGCRGRREAIPGGERKTSGVYGSQVSIETIRSDGMSELELLFPVSVFSHCSRKRVVTRVYQLRGNGLSAIRSNLFFSILVHCETRGEWEPHFTLLSLCLIIAS
jgi:hypothetical protein